MLTQKVNAHAGRLLGTRRAFSRPTIPSRSGSAPPPAWLPHHAPAGQAEVSRFSSTMTHALATASIGAVPELEGATYKEQLTAACEAVRLASKLCQAVQRQLADAEKVEKSDSSPVTVADYGTLRILAASPL
jgi:hypothetical protein